jgi:hypothetical protein
MSDLRETILAADDKERIEVEIPEWGVTVWLRGMTVGELQAFERKAAEFKRTGSLPPDYRESIAAQYVEDEDGAQVFVSTDVVQLRKRSAKAMGRILDAFQSVNGLTEKDLEEIEGN